MTPQSRTRLVSALRAVFAGARWRSLAQSLRQGAAASSVLRTYGSAAARSAGLSPRLRSFAQSVLLLPVVFVALIILFLAFWREHEARMRQTFELKALARQDAAQATALEARARAALMASEQRHAQALEDYDSQRRRLDREAQTLRQRLASLQAAERSQAERVATLPASNLANQVAARLGTLSHELTAENPPAHAFGPASGFNGPESPAGSQGTNVDSGAPPAEAEGPKASAAANFESPGAAAAGITIPQPELRSMAQALVQLDSSRQQAAVQDLLDVILLRGVAT